MLSSNKFFLPSKISFYTLLIVLYSITKAMVKLPVCANSVLSTASQFSYYYIQKSKAGTAALGINRKHSMSKERRLLEMFLLCWQGYEI